MVQTKGLAQTVKNWESAIGRVPAAYSEGVKAASNVIQRSLAAEDYWAAKVQEAASKRAREKGLQGISDEDWRKGALEKGVQRIGAGMQAGKQKFSSKIAEVLSTIEGVNLPPKTTDVAANVQNRVTPIAQALHERFKG